MSAIRYRRLMLAGVVLALAAETAALAQPPVSARDVTRHQNPSARLARRQFDPLTPGGLIGPGPDGRDADSFPTPSPESYGATPEDSSETKGSTTPSSTAPTPAGDHIEPIPTGELVDDEEFGYEEEAALSSTGTWYNRGTWYAQLEASMMNRMLQRQGLLLGLDLSTTLNGQIASIKIDPGQQQFAPGMEMTLGHFLGRDTKNRERSIEFTFLGAFQWHASESLTSREPNGIFTTINANETPGGFNDASFQSFTYDSNFNSYELNYRLARRLSRDRMVLSRNGEWVRTLAPAPLPAFIFGLRVVTMADYLAYISRGANPNITSGRYDVHTNNDLYGFQFGGDFNYQHEDWRLGLRIKGGPYINTAGQTSVVRQIVDSQQLATRDEQAQQTILTFLGDVKLTASYFFRPNFIGRLSYDLVWVNQLALAPYQLTFVPTTIPEIKVGSNIFCQSLMGGFELVW